MGRVRLRIPENWTVVPEFDTALGNVEDRTATGPDREKLLLVRGGVFMGRLEIRN